MLSDTVIRTDSVTGATSHLLELSLTQRRKVLSLERVLKLASYEEQPLFLRNDKSGKVALGIAAPSHMDEEGHMIRRYELVRPLRSEYLRADRLDVGALDLTEYRCKHANVFDADFVGGLACGCSWRRYRKMICVRSWQGRTTRCCRSIRRCSRSIRCRQTFQMGHFERLRKRRCGKAWGRDRCAACASRSVTICCLKRQSVAVSAS